MPPLRDLLPPPFGLLPAALVASFDAWDSMQQAPGCPTRSPRPAGPE
ncbi:hypothetical protein [Streptomyces venezuelae]|nr:hypothetical protein [Streptomyces venezuelae]